MTPEILIVGDASRRRGLIREVRDAGYEVTLCQPQELNRRVRTGTAPASILICREDADAAVLLATLRRSRQGAAIPVVLFGQLGGEIRDLADVLDLGADHFVRDPYDPKELRDSLRELAGPGSAAGEDDPPRSSSGRAGAVTSESGGGWSNSTERLSEDARRDVGGPSNGRDPVIGQLHRTLDRLEARLRDRGDDEDEPRGAPQVRPAELVRGRVAAAGVDHVDLDELGFDGIPDVAHEEGTLDPAELTGRHARRSQVVPDPDADTLDEEGPASPRDDDSAGGGFDPRREDSQGYDAASEERSSSYGRPREGSSSYGRRGGTGTGSEGTVRLDDSKRGEERSGVLSPRRPSRPDRDPEDERSRSGVAGLPGRGSIAEQDVPSLVWRLHAEGATGRLRLARGRVEKQLWLVRGELRFARSGSSADRFVDDLLRRGVLTRAQYETARRLAAREPRRAGELLIEAGLIKQDELTPLLADHLSHMVQSTFAWTEGTWTFEPGVTIEEPITLDADLARLMLDGIRHRVETSRLSTLLGPDLAAPRLIEGHDAARVQALSDRFDLLEREQSWLERFDGEHPLRSFLDEPDADEHGLLALVRAFEVIGVLELDGDQMRRGSRDPVEIDRDRVMERLRVAREADYFELLSLPRDATRTEVRRAHAEIFETFADHALEAGTVRDLEVELVELRAALREARDILMDDALRSAYLAHLDDAAPTA